MLSPASQMIATPSQRSRSWVLILAIAAGTVAAQGGPAAQPYQVGGVMDGAGLTAVDAGYLMAVQMACFSAAVLVASRFVDRTSLPALALSGATLAAGCYLVEFGLRTLLPLYLAAGTSGTGHGLIYAATVAAGSRASDPERVFGAGTALGLIGLGVELAVLPLVGVRLGPMGVFAGLAAMLVLLVPLLPGLGRANAAPLRETAGRVDIVGAAALVAVTALFGIGTGAVYTFTERIATALDIDPAATGLVLTVGMMSGSLGGAAAAWAGNRLGRRLPLQLGLLASGLACLAIGVANGFWGFAAAVVAYGITYIFPFPYFLGAGGALDRSGRLPAFANGMIFIASAVGSGAGGMIAVQWSYRTLGLLALAASILAAGLVPVVTSRAVEPAP
ncbi:MAG TPA: hypothetical protein VKS60_04820 [Stellaceae bacterium]|nr:hypothetical protein [Stellaceae bacterium]